MSRLYFLVFSGKSRADAETQHHIHESPCVMVGPLVLLAVGALLGGFIGIPGALFDHPDLNLLGHFFEPVLGAEMLIPHAIGVGLHGHLDRARPSAASGSPTCSTAAAIASRRTRSRSSSRASSALVRDKFRVDELYDAIFIRPLRKLSQWLFKLADRILIDKILVEGVGMVVDVFGRFARFLQLGDAQRYMACFAIGVAALVFFATRPPAPGELKVSVEGLNVQVDARRAGRQSPRELEYSYRLRRRA